MSYFYSICSNIKTAPTVLPAKNPICISSNFTTFISRFLNILKLLFFLCRTPTALHFYHFHMILHLLSLYKLVSSHSFSNFQASLFLEVIIRHLSQLLSLLSLYTFNNSDVMQLSPVAYPVFMKFSTLVITIIKFSSELQNSTKSSKGKLY